MRAPRPIWQFWDAQGRELTDRFPDDHPWHEGLSLAIAHVGNTNFWGGPTYQPGTAERAAGYQQLENLGNQAHQALRVETSILGSANSAIHITHELEWLDERVLPILSELRRMTLTVEDAQHWRLTWHTTLRNLSKGPVHLGSPATKGRAGAGYGGIFLRLAADYRDGILVDAKGNRGESVAEGHASWLRQYSTDASRPSVRLSSASSQPTWFARSVEYPGLGPAPFAETETTLASGDTVELEFEMTVARDAFSPDAFSQDASTQDPEVTP
ncbi:DUF6807 family protein [Gulosibacter chungangensis]|uniref:DUF6807 family protein n=1 Tax=Gulosibacter chungangensis TaxID=979746 RepID=UPI00178782E4|nr:DUF6807 family protein [Gulosibacter chungangensis]